MSGRGIDFLENWVNKNVAEADRKGSQDRTKELAALCVADAAELSITINDMEPEWGSVEDIIYGVDAVCREEERPPRGAKVLSSVFRMLECGQRLANSVQTY